MKYSVIDMSGQKDHTKKAPRVSVLMPCYDVAATIDETMQTMLAQTLEAFEIVAVDDGSTDETLSKLEAWSERDRRVRVLALPHGGIIPALNQGLAACRAAYIARMDADDRVHATRLERQVEYLDEHPDIAVLSSLVEGFPSEDVREGFKIYIDWLNSLVTNADIQREIFVESPLAHPSVTFRRRWVEELGGYKEFGWPEDYDLWLRLYLAGANFAKIPEILLYWREHPQRLTRTDSRYSVKNFLRAKAHYLMRGPLEDRDAVIIWGAGQMGRRLSKHLLREGAPIVAFIDIDPKKVGRTRKGRPILAPEALKGELSGYANPVVLAAVRSRGARSLIRERLASMGLREAMDWWAVA
ncbi:MAG: glycosyltransferase [Anaerolineales bacterium]|jgi:cellulose synthase/poly-beta-1,6-N-acetylglucosamine synthase-like glycosyltransferase